MKNNLIEKVNNEYNKLLEKFNKILLNFDCNKISTNIFKDVKISINNKINNIYSLANINIIDRITLKIIPYEKKNIQNIKLAILKSKINGVLFEKEKEIYFKLSILTEEKRLEIIKKIKLEIEKIKNNFRIIRNKINNEIKNNKIFSQDEKKEIKKKIQDIYNNKILYIKNILNEKIKNILKTK
ncbi:MAG: ribosome-recycling factor [Candidatus Shikimatogenerans sp. JK-2022]|nr:ribosome-recycling factor [Candidatus Shikimatogenerans bostrichidophilus]